MMEQEAKLVYELSLMDAQFRDGMMRATTLTKRLELGIRATTDQMEQTGKMAEMLAEKAASIAFDFLKDSVAAFNESAQASGKLEQALRSTHGAAGLTRSQLESQAAALQQVTLFSDQATVGAQSLLLGFDNLSGGIVTQAVPAIQDMATRMGTDLNSAATTVGTALNNPIEGIKKLEESGVSFTEAQKEMITSMANGDNAIGAQQVMLQALRSEFGGAAQMAAQVGTGPLQVLKNRFSDVQEAVGGLIVRGLVQLIPAVDAVGRGLNWVIDRLAGAWHWVNENKLALGILATGIAGFAIVANAAAIKTAFLTTVVKGATLAKQGAAAAGKVWTGVQTVLNAVLNANPIAKVIGGIAVLAAAFTYAYQNIGWFRGTVLGVWNVLVAFADFTKTVLMETFRGLGDMISGIKHMDGEEILRGYNRVGNAMRSAGKQVREAWNKGWEDGNKQIDEKDVAKKQMGAGDWMKQYQESQISGAQIGGVNALTTVPAGSAGGGNGFTPASGTTSVDKVSGNSPVNINVTINDGLVKTLNFTTNNYTEGMIALKEQIAEVLTGAIRDSQIIAA